MLIYSWSPNFWKLRIHSHPTCHLHLTKPSHSKNDYDNDDDDYLQLMIIASQELLSSAAFFSTTITTTITSYALLHEAPLKSF